MTEGDPNDASLREESNSVSRFMSVLKQFDLTEYEGYEEITGWYSRWLIMHKY